MEDLITAGSIPHLSKPGSIPIMFSVDNQSGDDKSATGARNIYKLSSEIVTIGPWNVRTFYCRGKVIELEYEPKR